MLTLALIMPFHAIARVAASTALAANSPALNTSPFPKPPSAPASSVRIHFKPAPSWKSAYLHYWATTPDQLATVWPGIPMAPAPEDGAGWYAATVSGQTALHLVFSDAGGAQTGDLTYAAPEGWYRDGDWWNLNPEHFDLFSFPGGRRKALIMSFDDGNTQDERLVAIFNRYGIRGTFHLNSGLLLSHADNHVPPEVAPQVYAGHEISGHSLTHPHLKSLSDAAAALEVRDDRRNLGSVFAEDVRGFAYPFGEYTPYLLGAMPGWGFTYARVVETTGDFRLPNDLMLWRGSGYHKDAAALGARFLADASAALKILFIWGHSWDFDNNTAQNNWDYIEGFCRDIGGRDDIWYAGALEVADYLNALRQVTISGDGQTFFNGSTRPVWVRGASAAQPLLPRSRRARQVIKTSRRS